MEMICVKHEMWMQYKWQADYNCCNTFQWELERMSYWNRIKLLASADNASILTNTETCSNCNLPVTCTGFTFHAKLALSLHKMKNFEKNISKRFKWTRLLGLHKNSSIRKFCTNHLVILSKMLAEYSRNCNYKI